MDRKGFVGDLFSVAIIGFVLSLVIILSVKLWAIWISNPNLPGYVVTYSGPVTTALGTLDFLMMSAIIGSILGGLIFAYFIPANPIFVVPSIVLWVIAVVVAVPFSNSYFTIMATDALNSTAALFPITNLIMLNIPTIVGVFGLVLFIMLFAKPGQRVG